MEGPETGGGGLVHCFGDARLRSGRLLAKGPQAAYWSVVGAAVAQLVEQRIRNAVAPTAPRPLRSFRVLNPLSKFVLDHTLVPFHTDAYCRIR